LKRIGLLVNPIAGIGGRVGLKGSDGQETQKRARELGAVPFAPVRTLEALMEIKKSKIDFRLITYPKPMGEIEAREAGFSPIIIGYLKSTKTTSTDTRNAARELLEYGVDLLLFSGGDGTARDIYNAIDSEVPVLGIPAGVKIHSGVFATSPKAAGRLAVRFLEEDLELRDTEVMDIDEEAFRDNRISARLYGYMKTPFVRELIQGSKEGTSVNEGLFLKAIAAEVVGDMKPDITYIIGPGTTTKPVADELGIEKTLLGVDVVKGGKLLAKDVNEEKLLNFLVGNVKIIVSVIGGQGFIFGRGNQQISPKVIKQVGKDNIIILATSGKLATLRGNSLRVDTGDAELDETLKGYYKVVTGFARRTMYKVE
jgi:predicted polyphosphate/ATP-dependent NAD kinase